jgi:hypothetical protein
MISFYTINYLKNGNAQQKLAYVELNDLRLMEILKEYDPLLAGTIPINIDLPGSDLDIVCHCIDHKRFANAMIINFGSRKGFEIYTKPRKGIKTTVARFFGNHFPIEIFGQDIPSEKQAAFQHMLIECRILMEKGENFRNDIRKLKQQGYKTEPAFAKLLKLEGDPYEALLRYALP